jgi:hypothetical protein
MLKSLTVVSFSALLLSGCAGVRLVDTDVRSFVTSPGIQTGATYRFERLPSQRADATGQARLETLAQAALGKVGLRRQDNEAQYSVQMAASLRIDPYAPWEQPYGGRPGLSLGFGVRHGYIGLATGRPFMPGFGWGESPYYWREVSLVIRHLGSGQVVYETQGAHDGRWSDSQAVLPAMLDAALMGFPNPPAGPRRIELEIPR